MDILEALLLGILQGVTEFLPVSSSGHLVLAQELLNRNLDRGITFEIVVHFGSMFSIMIYYRTRIGEILLNLYRFVSHPLDAGKNWNHMPDIRLVAWILLSMIPAGWVGFTFKDELELIFSSPVLVSSALLVTGFILYANKFAGDTTAPVSHWKGFIMGVAQALAMIPGISRSGTTITTGVYLGIKRETVAEFSFLMLLPVLAGAMLLEVRDMADTGIETGMLIELIAAFFASLISGYLSLKYLLKIFKSRALHYFAYYVWAVGIAGIIWFGIII